MKEVFVPIDLADTPRVRFVLPLPEYVDRERIGVDVNRIERLCKFSGVEHLRVTGESDGETSSFTPVIVGFSKNGEAYAAKTGAKTKTPTFSMDSSFSNENFSLFRTSKATLKININEIANRIMQEAKWDRSVRNPMGWAILS